MAYTRSHEALTSGGRHRVAPGWHQVAQVPRVWLDALRPWWDDLPPDPDPDAGHRFRRMDHFRVEAGGLLRLPARPGLEGVGPTSPWGGPGRSYAPLADDCVAHPAFLALVDDFLARLPIPRHGLFLRVHQIRVVHDAQADLVARPDPEVPHREGRLFVSILPMTIRNLEPGDTCLYSAADQPPFARLLLAEGEQVTLDDRHVLHATEPYRAVTGRPAFRDICLMTVTDRASGGGVPDPGGRASGARSAWFDREA